LQLNLQQQAAVSHTQGPLLILAGAGAGKTRVLTERIKHLVHSKIAAPFEIMAVTFTNKAANELKNRIRNNHPELQFAEGLGIRGMWVGTFHSICGKILRLEIENLGYTRRFVILDDGEQISIIKDALKLLDLDDKKFPPRAMLSNISRAKSNSLKPDELGSGYYEEKVSQVYAHYQESLKRQNALDFDDMLLLTVELFERFPVILDRYARRFRHILVDEYQDTNPTQYKLIRLLSSYYPNLCVVGDADQSIYSFRAADFRIILRFQQDFPDATVIKLEQNYRSTQHILSAANAVIDNNVERVEKTLWTENPAGDKVVVYHASDDRDESEYIIEQIKKHNYNLNDVAVLYRTNAQSRAIEEALLRWSIPYRLIGGIRFYDRKEIKDVLAYLRMLFNPYDEMAITRAFGVPKRGIGPVTLKKWFASAKQKDMSPIDYALRGNLGKSKGEGAIQALLYDLKPVLEIIDTAPVAKILALILDKSGLEASLRAEGTDEANGRLENISELLNLAARFSAEQEDNSLDHFMIHIALVSDQDSNQPDDRPQVTLMTLHAAKGLEFSHVYLTGLEEGIFPHQRALQDQSESELEEERRLAYVGLTRAEKTLTLSHAARRFQFGEAKMGIPSRFVDEIPYEVVSVVKSPYIINQEREMNSYNRSLGRSRDSFDEFGDDSFASSRPRTLAPLNTQTYVIGQQVTHAAWGKGTVVQTFGTGSRQTIAVSFPGLGKRILDPSVAPLK
jgi:DNA helicase II / ATP-dependent DNA helicase PcrA